MREILFENVNLFGWESIFKSKLTVLRMLWERIQSSVCHILMVLSAEQLRKAPDERPAADSSGTSGNI